MLKTSILNYHTYLRNSIRSSSVTLWLIFLIVLPVSLFFALFIFESELVAVLMSLFPPSRQQGEAYYHDMIYLARMEVLWLGFFFLLTFALLVYASKNSLDSFLDIRSKSKAIYFIMLICSASFLTSILVSSQTLERFPNSSDEYAYLFQAEMFSRGKLWERAHDLPDFFQHINIPQHDGILVSRFPPGWPLLLSIAFEVGFAPFLVNPVLGLISLVVFYFFARRYYGQSVAVWGLLALAVSGYYIFNSASFFSHVSCLVATLLFVYSVYLFRDKNKFIYGVSAGFFLGLVVVIRYYTAVLIFVPFLVYLLYQYRIRSLYLFFWMGIGSIPCLAYLFWYNYAITGNALVPVTVWAYPNEKLGFVKGHTVWKGIEHLIRRGLMFLYWCSPGLLILYLVYLWRKVKSPAERLLRPEDYAFVALIVGYFFYYEIGGNQYGPRFLFEALPFVVLLVVSKVLQLREKWAVALFFASIIYAIVKFPFIVHREEYIVDQRKDLYHLVEEQRIRNAVVFVSSPTSPIRPMPAKDLTRNDPRFVNDVIYVLELPHINEQLMEYYGDRSVYKYVRDLNEPHGELIRIR